MPRTLKSLCFCLAALALMAPGAAPSRASSAELGGPDRFLTAVSTDKPIYRAGDSVYVRGVVLNAASRVPVKENSPVRIELKGPKGDTLTSANTNIVDGTWGYAWPVAEGTPGGEYTVHVTYPFSGHAPADRKFDVRAYRAPRLKTQIVFLRDGYGPGDKVTATVDVKRAEGGIPSGAKVTATADVDGVEVARVPSTVGANGLCTVSFELPKQIQRGEGSLAFAIEDGGVVETAAKTIPILLQTLDLAFFPGGGDLVAGLPAVVYVEAKTPAKKPADLEGEILEAATGKSMGAFRTAHEGRGKFAFTPARGGKYELRVDRPSGISRHFPLPAVKDEGASLSSTRDTFGPNEPVEVMVASTQAQKLTVTLSAREKELAQAVVDGSKSGQKVALKTAAEGVLIVTVWGPGGTPLAERLVFRAPANPLTVELKPDKKRYVPGDTVKLTVVTTQAGKPVSAVVGVTVADDSVLEMIEKREQAPSLPVMVLLEPEVRDLADAHVYLDPKNPKAPVATDLLLGTQGWRRFAFVHSLDFISQYGDGARRVLALRAASQQEIAEGIGDLGRAGGGAVNAEALPGMAPRGRPMDVQPKPVAAAAPPPVAKPAAPPPAVVAPIPPRQVVANGPMAPPAEQARPELEAALERGKNAMGAGIAMRQDRRQSVGFVSVRVHAHALKPGRKPNDRTDFTETLFWTAAVRTSPAGEASVSFALNDSVTSFRASAGGYTDTGALGTASLEVESVQPFYLEPKIPLEVTTGDLISLPVALVSGVNEPLLTQLNVTGGGDVRIKDDVVGINLAPNARVRMLPSLLLGRGAGTMDLVLSATAGAYSDKVTRQLVVKPAGFPFDASFGGQLSAEKPASHEVTLPADVQLGSVVTRIGVFPTPLGNMTEALSRLIQDPSGCFEQTSSTSYPLTMAQQYFLSHTGVDPKVVSLAKEKLEAGYKRLAGFECSDKGYEWFGENPGHEALTAYGLLHFTDMTKVREVDQKMLTNTRAWLLKQRDGAGGFTRKRRALHTWVEDKDSSDAYITWALLESGEKGLEKETAHVKDAAEKSKNSYMVALAANVTALVGDKPGSSKLYQRLSKQQLPTGVVGGATQSIVGSTGQSLDVETTSLATLAWLRDPAYAGNVEKAMKYLADVCQGGRYGSTQSTVLALRAIVAYDKSRAHPKGSGSVRLYVDGKPIGDAVKFDGKTEGAIKLPEVAELLGKGKHTLALKMEGGGGGAMPYAISVKWNALKPDSSPKTKVALELGISKAKIAEGELAELTATVINTTGELLPTTIAIIGLPGGLEPRHDQLKELVKKGTVDAYEVLGREIVLYWRGMEPNAKLRVPLSLIAAVPGVYTGPASRAYLYYGDEDKVWVEGLKAEITPKG